MKHAMMLKFRNIAAAVVLAAAAGGCSQEVAIDETPEQTGLIAFSVAAGAENAASNTRAAGARGVVVTAQGTFDAETGEALDAPATRGLAIGKGEQNPTIPVNGSIGVYTWFLPSPDGGTTAGTLDRITNAATIVPYGAWVSAADNQGGNVAVTRSVVGANNVYSYAPAVEWPKAKNDHLKFFAYYPYSADRAATSGVSKINNLPALTIPYATSTDPTKHEDLMVAMSDDLYHVASVPLKLEHLLTRLTFQARLEDDVFLNQTVTVTKLELSGLKLTGTVTTGPKDKTNPNDMVATWATSGAAGTITASNQATGLNDFMTNPLRRDGHTDLLSATGDMMVIPQALDGIVLTVTLNIEGVGTETRSVVLKEAQQRTWDVGTYVNYRLLISPLEVSIEGIDVLDWDEKPQSVKPDATRRMDIDRTRLWFGREGTNPGPFVTNITTTGENLVITGPFNAATKDETTVVNWFTHSKTDGAQTGSITVNQVGEYTGAAARDAYFVIKSGNLEYEYHIIQSHLSWIDFEFESGNCYPLDGMRHSLGVTTEVQNWWVDTNVAWWDGLNGSSTDAKIEEWMTTSGSGDGHIVFRSHDAFGSAEYHWGGMVFHHEVCKDVQFNIPMLSGRVIDEEQDANSFMFNADHNMYSSGIYIPVGRANRAIPGSIPMGAKLKAEFLWTDYLDDVNHNPIGFANMETPLRYYTTSQREGGYLLVSHGRGDGHPVEGNAAVGVTVDGQLKWQWHFWTTFYVPDADDANATDGRYTTTGGDVYRFTSTGGARTVLMDRNLGATSANPVDQGKTYGTMYDWGTMNPRPARAWNQSHAVPIYDESGATITLDTPFIGGDTDEWSDTEKTVYDPCPAGWRVPSYHSVTGIEALSGTWFNTDEGLSVSGNRLGYWPSVGYQYEHGVYNLTSTIIGAGVTVIHAAPNGVNPSKFDFLRLGGGIDAIMPVRCVAEEQPLPGMVFDQTKSDPANITGYDGAEINAILAKMRRALVKKTGEGQVTIAYLDNNNSNKYADGSAADLTGTEGDVMVYKPEFWYRHHAGTNQFSYELSATQPQDADTWIKSPASLIGAYQSNVISDRMYSRSGVAPTRKRSQATAITDATARGTGYQIIDFEQHSMIALLFYAKYGTRDSQAILGTGNTNYTTKNGLTNDHGNSDTDGETSHHASFAGIEGVHGGMMEWVGGVRVDKGVWEITDPDGQSRTVTGAPKSGYIKEIAAAAGPYFDMVPTTLVNEASHYYVNYYYMSNTQNTVLARSGLTSNGGLSYTSASNGPSDESDVIASRLAFRGTIVEESNVAAFKALPVSN